VVTRTSTPAEALEFSERDIKRFKEQTDKLKAQTDKRMEAAQRISMEKIEAENSKQRKLALKEKYGVT
jgi:hypothetical protein